MMKITLLYFSVVLSSINFAAAKNECFLLVSIEPCGKDHALSFHAKRTVTRHLQASDQEHRICLPVGCDGDHRMKGQAVLVHDKTTTEFSENYDLLYVDVDSCEAGTYVNAEISCDPSLSQKHKVVRRWQNGYDEALDVDCPDRQAFYRVRSEHHDGAEDRIWQWDCKEVTEISRSCYTTGYINSFDELILFQCDTDYVMAGVHSYHDNGAEDRRWKFTCCRAEGYYTKNCQLSDYLNDWDAAIDYSVGSTSSRVFVGAFSEHSNPYEDRRWKIMSCEYVSDIFEVSTTQDKYVVGEGNSVVVKCTTVGGRAPSDIKFFSPSGLLLNGAGSEEVNQHIMLSSITKESTSSSNVTYSRTLTLSGALVGDSGTYTCEAEENASFDVTVEAILSINVTLEVIIQQPVKITCLATVFTPSTITWWREVDGEMIQIVSDSGTDIYQEKFGQNLLWSFLEIEKMDSTHIGTYNCKVATTSNNFQADVTLALIKESPETPVKITETSPDSRWVALEVTAVSDENKPIEFFTIYYNEFSIDFNIPQDLAQGLLHGNLFSITYNISSNILPNTNYVFTVSSCNDLGCSETKDIVPVTTLPSSSSPPQKLTVSNTDTTSLWLTWMEPEMPNGNISFYKVKYVGTKLYNISEALLSSLSLEGDRDTTGPTFFFILTELVPGTQYTVTVTAFNEAGKGMPSSPVVESTLVDSPPSGEEGFLFPNGSETTELVMISDQRAEIVLPRPLNINGALSHHQVVVVLLPEDFSPASLLPADALFPNIDTFMTYADSKTYKGPNPVAYITAEFDDKLFPSDSVFTVGVDGQPNDRQYENGPLPRGTTFAFFLRAYPLIDISEIDKVHEKERQYSLFSSSDFVYDNALESEPKTVIIIGGSAGAAGFAVILIVVFIIALVAVIKFRKKKVIIERGDIQMSMSELVSKENADLDVSKEQVANPVYYSCGSMDDNIYENPYS